MTVFAFVYTGLSFLVFWVLYFWAQKRLKIYFQDEFSYQVRFVIFHRILGFVLFGIIPILIGIYFFREHWRSWGLILNNLKALLPWCIGIILLLIPFNRYISRTKTNQAIYPQMRVREWTSSLFLLNAGLWVLYLLGYEFVFRGMLFFTTLSTYGFWPAVLSNALLYALVHIPKGRKEIGGAFVLGLFLCFGCYYTGGFWFALIVHGFQAIFNEFHAIKYNPEMVFRKEKETVSNWDKLS